MTWTILLWLASAAIAGLITSAVMKSLIAYLRVRTNELKIATQAFDDYESAIKKLISDPATPASLMKYASEIDRAVGKRSVARRFAIRVFTGRALVMHGHMEDEKGDAAFNELKQLGKHRSDLEDAFITVIASGFIATMLKWPLSARAFRLILIDPRRDPMTPANTLTIDHSGVGENRATAAA